MKRGAVVVWMASCVLGSWNVVALPEETQESLNRPRSTDVAFPVCPGETAVPASSPEVRSIVGEMPGDGGVVSVDHKREPSTAATEEFEMRASASSIAQERGSDSTPPPSMTFEGLDAEGFSPPDPNGAVGPNHYVQMVNVSFIVFDKQGTPLTSRIPFDQLFAGSGLSACENNNHGYPRVLYDREADRWILGQPVFESQSGYQCFVVSQTPDPLGPYWLYQFAVPEIPDYPMIGVWSDGYYLGSNSGTGTYVAFAFDRANMLIGNPASYQYSSGHPNLLMPADIDGAALPPPDRPGTFYTMYSGLDPDHPPGTDRLAIYEFDVDWINSDNSTFVLSSEIPITPFNYTVCGPFFQDCIPQPGTAQRLDSRSDWPMWRLAYRRFGAHETMVGNFTVDVDGTDRAGIRWFELRDGGSGWALHQEGTHTPDPDHRWMASIAIDGAGNIALGYSTSSSTTLHEIRYATRSPDDPLGTLGSEQTLYASSGVHTGLDRWGDYTSMTVDPSDDCTFWYTNQYDLLDNSGFDWRTRVGTFAVQSCLDARIFSDGFESGDTGAWSGK